MSRGRLVILSAPSGAGKTSLARELLARREARGQRVAFSVSYTTRAPRPGEVDGVDYHFVDDVTFAQMVDADEFLEHAGVFGRRYGTGRSATEEALRSCDLVLLDIDWQGARQVKARLPWALSVFILPPSLEALESRLRGRGQDSAEVIATRMAAARDELAHASEFDHQLINADFATAVAELDTLIGGSG